MVREWLLEGDLLAKGWRFSCDFFLLVQELILCQNQLRQKIAASESRSVRKSQRQKVTASEDHRTKKGLEAHPLSKFCVHCHALHCFVEERSPVASENPKKEAQLRQKTAASESRRPKKALKLILFQNLVFSSHFRLFCRQPPGKKPSCVRQIAASESRASESCRPKQHFCTNQCRIFGCGCSSPSVPSCPMAETLEK